MAIDRIVLLDSLTERKEELTEKLGSGHVILQHTITTRGIWESPAPNINNIRPMLLAEKPWIAMNDNHHKKTRKHRK